MQPLKFANGLVISTHTLLGMRLLIHTGIKVNHVSKAGARKGVVTNNPYDVDHFLSQSLEQRVTKEQKNRERKI